MPIRCAFELNRKESSRLICHGYGTVEAFSGQKQRARQLYIQPNSSCCNASSDVHVNRFHYQVLS